jgi:hypothetical protein
MLAVVVQIVEIESLAVVAAVANNFLTETWDAAAVRLC